MKTWLALVVLLVCQKGRADVVAPLICEYAQTLYSPFTFREVEFINRVPRVGLRRTGTVTLDPRVDLAENAWLGIDQEGRLLNVVRVGQRTLAFLLSGSREIKDFYFRPPMTLVALDREGQLLQFDWREGATTLSQRLWKRAQKFGGTACIANGFVALYALWMHLPPSELEVWMGALFGTVASVGVHAFAELNSFEFKNQVTDGMRELGVRVAEFKRSEFERGFLGDIEDYRLTTRAGELSLNALLSDRLRPAGRGFEADCAYALIPDGKNRMDD